MIRPMIRIQRGPDGFIIFPKRKPLKRRRGGGVLRVHNLFSLDNFEGGFINQGRFMVYLPDHLRANKRSGYIGRSIAAYEAYHGVTILPGIVVHHVDEDPLNDSKENLQLMTKSDHSRNNLRRLHGL